MSRLAARSWLPLLLVAACSLAAPLAHGARKPRPAEATPLPDNPAERKVRAQRAVAEGRALFDRASFAEAAERFELAYKLFPVPKMLYNLGITYDALHRDDRATCALEQFLGDVPDAEVALRKDSEDRLTRLRRTVARVHVAAPAGTALFLDGEELGTTPTPVPLCATAGNHRLVASRDGIAPVGLDLVVRPAATLRVSLDPAGGQARLLSDSGAVADAVARAADQGDRKPLGPPPPPDSRPVWKKGWFWGVLGVVAVGATVGIVLATRPPDVTPPAADYGPIMVFK